MRFTLLNTYKAGILFVLLFALQNAVSAQTTTDTLQLRTKGINPPAYLKLYSSIPTASSVYGIQFPPAIPAYANQLLQVNNISGTTAQTTWVDSTVFKNTYWALLGNANTTATALNALGSKFIGTTDAYSLVFKTNNTLAGYIGKDSTDNLTYGVNAGIATTVYGNNIFMGNDAGYNNLTGVKNTFIGTVSGYSNTTGSQNVFLGTNTGYSNTTAKNDVFIGNASGFNNTTGTANVFMGNSAGYQNITGTGNTFLGFNSGRYNTTGNYNTLIGDSCGDTKQTIQYGTFLGCRADASADGLTNVTAIGYNAQVGAGNSLVLGGTGSYAVNVGIGTTTPNARLEIDTTGSATAALKIKSPFTGAITDSLLTWNATDSSVRKVTVSSWINGTAWSLTGNSGTGATALNSLGTIFLGTTDAHSLVFKTNSTLAGYIGSNPADNLTYGINAGQKNTTGTANTFLGAGSGQNNTSGNYNTFLGNSSGNLNTTGNCNTFLGLNSGQNNTSGINNTFVGYNSGNQNTTGYYNTFLGFNSGFYNTTGINNTFQGYASGQNNSKGNRNTFLGYNSGNQNTTGNFNTFIGDSCGSSKQTIQYGTFLGYGADASVDGLTNVTAIGYNAQAGASNSLVLGGTGSYAVNVGIGVNAPGAGLEINTANGKTLKLDTLQSGNVQTDSILVWRKTDSIVRKISGLPISGNIIAMSSFNAGINNVVQFDGMQIRWNTVGWLNYDAIEISTVSGSRVIRYDMEELWNGASYFASAAWAYYGDEDTYYNSTLGTGTNLTNGTYPNNQTITTTWITMGNFGLPNSDLRFYYLFDITNQNRYKITVIKKASTGEIANPQVGTVDIWVEKIGITSGTVVSANNGLTVNAANSAGTTVQLGGTLNQNTSIAAAGNTLNVTGGNVGMGNANATTGGAVLQVSTTGIPIGFSISNGSYTGCTWCSGTSSGIGGSGSASGITSQDVVEMGPGWINSERAGLNANMLLAKNTAASGNQFINFFVAGNSVGTVTYNGTGTSYNTTSDLRLKENIKPTGYGIADVMKIGVKDYNFKSDSLKTKQTGFIAQDLYEIFPNAVTKGGDDPKKEPWQVDYGKVTPLLVKAVQDQQKEIEDLKAEIKELKKLIQK